MKVGDKVRIVKNIGGYSSFNEYIGKTYQIVKSGGHSIHELDLDGDGKLTVWSDEELELVNPLDNLEVGDVVEDRNGDKLEITGEIKAYTTKEKYGLEDVWLAKKLEEKSFKLSKPTITIDGKEYLKDEVVERVKKLKEVK